MPPTLTHIFTKCWPIFEILSLLQYAISFQQIRPTTFPYSLAEYLTRFWLTAAYLSVFVPPCARACSKQFVENSILIFGRWGFLAPSCLPTLGSYFLTSFFEPRPLVVNMARPAFAAERRAATPFYCSPVACDRTVPKLLLRCSNGTDRRTDTVPLH